MHRNKVRDWHNPKLTKRPQSQRSKSKCTKEAILFSPGIHSLTPSLPLSVRLCLSIQTLVFSPLLPDTVFPLSLYTSCPRSSHQSRPVRGHWGASVLGWGKNHENSTQPLPTTQACEFRLRVRTGRSRASPLRARRCWEGGVVEGKYHYVKKIISAQWRRCGRGESKNCTLSEKPKREGSAL